MKKYKFNSMLGLVGVTILGLCSGVVTGKLLRQGQYSLVVLVLMSACGTFLWSFSWYLRLVDVKNNLVKRVAKLEEDFKDLNIGGNNKHE